MPKRGNDTDDHGRLIPPLNDQASQLLSSWLPFILQCYHRETHPQLLENGYIHILLEGEIPNGIRGWRDNGGLGIGSRVLPGSVGLKGKPYLDDRGKNPRGYEGFRDDWVGGRRIDKDNQGRDEPSHLNEEKNHRFFWKRTWTSLHGATKTCLVYQ